MTDVFTERASRPLTAVNRDAGEVCDVLDAVSPWRPASEVEPNCRPSFDLTIGRSSSSGGVGKAGGTSGCVEGTSMCPGAGGTTPDDLGGGRSCSWPADPPKTNRLRLPSELALRTPAESGDSEGRGVGRRPMAGRVKSRGDWEASVSGPHRASPRCWGTLRMRMRVRGR